MHLIAKQMVSCDKSMEAEELNYPSISVRFGLSPEKTVVRTAKSVRKKSTVFWARIEEPEGVRMDLSRYELSFSRLNQEESFEIKFRIQGRRPRRGHVSQGRLSWVSKTRVVQASTNGVSKTAETYLFRVIACCYQAKASDRRAISSSDLPSSKLFTTYEAAVLLLG